MKLLSPPQHIPGKLRGILIVAILATGPVAWAHPGHTWSDAGAGHLVTSLDHATVLAFLGILAGLFSHLLRTRGLRVIFRALGAAAILSAALLWTGAI